MCLGSILPDWEHVVTFMAHHDSEPLLVDAVTIICWLLGRTANAGPADAFEADGVHPPADILLRKSIM